ncbi:hypothetical protein [Rhizobium sullae]|uniref:hypothetical protein n=1 Tax=Rhizobium sullae TaxID=50338 RepID=UPI000B34FC13|nr:hypothetical protein [Rhizobium sullae]
MATPKHKTWLRPTALLAKLAPNLGIRWFHDHKYDPGFPEIRYAGRTPLIALEDGIEYFNNLPTKPTMRSKEEPKPQAVDENGEPIKRRRGRPRKQPLAQQAAE